MLTINPTTHIKSIKTCKNFIKPALFNDISNGQCKLFSNIDLVTGEIKYKYASIVRNYERCGSEALMHSDNKKECISDEDITTS